MLEVGSTVHRSHGMAGKLPLALLAGQTTTPKVDHAKRAATKAELKVAKRLRKAPGVLKVHHAVRLTKIEGGKSRREVDLIAVMQDRLVLIEVKISKESSP